MQCLAYFEFVAAQVHDAGGDDKERAATAKVARTVTSQNEVNMSAEHQKETKMHQHKLYMSTVKTAPLSGGDLPSVNEHEFYARYESVKPLEVGDRFHLGANYLHVYAHSDDYCLVELDDPNDSVDTAVWSRRPLIG